MDNVTVDSGNQYKKRVNKIIDEMTLFDDDLMTLVFDKNISATELILRIILGRRIRVISVKAQEELRSPLVGGRDITLDIHAVDEDGEDIDVEVQSSSDGAHVRRARFHSAVLDSRNLREREEFKKLRDSYVIFIYKHDKFGKGLPIYRVERVVFETGEAFDDGSHIVYVNGKYKGDDEIGKLIQDFYSTSPDDMNYKELSDSVRHFKKTEKGRDVMSELLQKYADECVARSTVENVKNLMKNMNMTLEQALDAMGISGKERSNIMEKLSK